MGKRFEYTTLAHRHAAMFPRATYVGKQVNFWILANVLLATIAHFVVMIIAEIYNLNITSRFLSVLLISVILAVLYGLCLGFVGYYVEKQILRGKSLGVLIILKALISFGLLLGILALLRYVLFEPVIGPWLNIHRPLHEEVWKGLFWLLALYYFVANIVISFINQVNNKYGPGILIPLLLGRYRNPREQVRIFLFMDLRSSTTTAEQLGHLRYSAFIRDCFMDINAVLYQYRAQVYQYVGDEIVVTWPEAEGLKDHNCIAFYFACRKQFQDRETYYLSNYGFLPEFKAGTHTGKVTAVEIGEVKRDIAYHGDTLNTAARIQSVCNDYDKIFLISEDLINKLGSHQKMSVQSMGRVLLKGKSSEIGIYAVNWQDNR